MFASHTKALPWIRLTTLLQSMFIAINSWLSGIPAFIIIMDLVKKLQRKSTISIMLIKYQTAHDVHLRAMTPHKKKLSNALLISKAAKEKEMRSEPENSKEEKFSIFYGT
jgi:hypothetical protein